MKKLIVLLTAVLAFPLFATEPPKSGNVPEYAYAPDPPAPRRLPVTKPTDFPRTPEELTQNGPLRGALFEVALDKLRQEGKLHTPPPFRGTTNDAQTATAARRSFRPTTLAVPTFYEITTRNTTNGMGFNPAEPVITSVTNPTSGVTYTANLWIGAFNDREILHNFSTDGVTYSAPATFPRPVAYTDAGGFMGDPEVTSLMNSGTSMGHMYAVMSGYHRPGFASGQSGVYLYGSANGGQTWSGPVEVGTTGDGVRPYDQPVITSSWATGTNTANFRYIAWTVYDNANRNTGQIRFRRSRGPIFCFSRCHIVGPTTPAFDPEQTVANGNLASPQVAVDATGAVHLTYVRYFSQGNAHTIEEIVSNVPADPSQALAWSAPTVVATLWPVNTYSPDPLINSTINGGIRAVSIPRMRFNPAANRIGIVWHATNFDGGLVTQIYYSSRPAGPGGTWQAPVLIDAVAGRDLFMPALDSDQNGNVLLGWYDRRNDPNNIDYQYFVRYITSTGGATGLGSQQASAFSSRASIQQWNGTQWVWVRDPNYFLGDYHAIWRWNGRWNASWAGRPTATLVGDNYVSDVR